MNEENCARCGTPASPGAKFCESCGAPLTREEGQPPRAVRTQEPAYGAPQYAPPPGYPAQRGPSATAPFEGVSIRFVALLIDTIIIGVISSILTAPFFALSLTRLATRAILFGPTIASRVLIVLVIYFLYFTLLEGHGGQTVGKKAVKIRVVREADGSPIDYGEAAVRTLLRIIDGLFAYLIGAILIWSSDKKQRLGDRVAHTIVVKE
ncbi:MAG: RDD family protein [Halobacteriota archaeon]